MRLERDGWKCLQQGKFTMTCWSGWKTEQTEIWEKKGRGGKRLRRELIKIDFESYGGPYVVTFTLILKNGSPLIISDASWADLDQRDKLVFARFGKVFRGSLRKHQIDEIELIDLNENKPPKRAANNATQSDARTSRR
jgi:hypothetical protein